MKLSKKMLEAGWNIILQKNGSYSIFGSNNQQYTYSPATGIWSYPKEKIEKLLQKDLEQIQLGNSSSIITASRLTALSHTKKASQPIQMICKNKWVTGKNILHLGTGKDVQAKVELLKSGGLNVADYDPNFYPDRQVLNKKYDVVISNYLLNILPPAERRLSYMLLKNTLKEDGKAYLTVQGVWPVENKYNIKSRYYDGYLIQTGFNKTFRKGYTSEAFLKEIKDEIGGKPELIKMFYSNSFVVWRKF